VISFDRLLRAAAVVACIVLAAGAAGRAAAQAQFADRPEGVFSIGIPRADDARRSGERPIMMAAPPPAQVQAIWDLGAAGSWDAASQRLERLEASNTDWRAPADLKAYLSAGKRDQRIRDALAAADWHGALDLIPVAGKEICEPPFDLWSRAEALERLGDQDQLEAFYVRVLNYCREPSLVASLAERGLSVLDASGVAALRSVEALEQSSDPKITRARERIIRAEVRLRFEAAAEAGDLATALALASDSDDPRLLVQAGWVFLKPDPSRAADLFERAVARGADSDAQRGLVMATTATRNVAAARRAIARAPDRTTLADLEARVDLLEAATRRDEGDWVSAVSLADRAAGLDPELSRSAQAISGGALLDAAAGAYDAGDFETARRFARQAAAYAPTARAGLMRAAWSDLQLGNAPEAAAAFSRLYLELPDVESAEGYALAAEKTGELDSAAALARALGGPLGAKVEARYAAAAFIDGDYLTARAYAPDTYAALEGLDRTWYRQSASLRSQGGISGENRLRALVSTTSAGTSRGTNRFEAGVSVYTLDPGRAASPAISASRESFAAPYVAWSREGETSLAARIGLLPVASDADPVLTADLAIVHQAGDGEVEARAFSRPRTDSVLAFAGQKDASGSVFGRVAETGVLVRGRLPVGQLHAVQADLSAAHLEGENTADNDMFAAGLSASRAVPRKGFAYLVTGPFYQFQSYDRNTNFFTDGHGGYFSPQTFHRVGWSANAQTEPLKGWIAKADIALAHESVEEDPALANLLVPGPQPLVGGSKSSGAAGALELAVARRVTTNVIISANLSAIASQAYEDFRIGIAFTWTPGGRDGLVRNDLPTDPFNPASWIRP